MLRHTAIIDASSAIILCKAGLHDLLAETYDIVLPESVYQEITANTYAGAEEYKQLASRQKIRVLENPEQNEKPGMAALDAGEYDAIRLFYAGLGKFVITDDGPAARYCKKENVPFINALLFPAVLRFARIKDEQFCRRTMEKIIEKGRYSSEVIEFARKCRQEHIAFALP